MAAIWIGLAAIPQGGGKKWKNQLKCGLDKLQPQTPDIYLHILLTKGKKKVNK